MQFVFLGVFTCQECLEFKVSKLGTGDSPQSGLERSGNITLYGKRIKGKKKKKSREKKAWYQPAYT